MAKKTATVTAPLAPLDMMAALASRASAAPTKEKKKDERTVLTLTPALEVKVMDMIRLTTLTGEIEPLSKQYKNEVTNELFLIWTDRMWSSKSLPDNPRIVINKRETNGAVGAMKDCGCIFQVKFNSSGVKKSLPNKEDLPAGKSSQDFLKEMLMSPAIGLSEAKALALLNPETGEIQVETFTTLKDTFDNLHASEDPVTKSAFGKMFAHLMATGDKKGMVELPAYTPAEVQALLVTGQTVNLKDGFFERAVTYCDTLEQLRNLLKFTKPTLSISSVEFGVSDSAPDRLKRHGETVVEFLTGE